MSHSFQSCDDSPYCEFQQHDVLAKLLEGFCHVLDDHIERMVVAAVSLDVANNFLHGFTD